MVFGFRIFLLIVCNCLPSNAKSPASNLSIVSLKTRQSIASLNPFDHSWIKEWAALGDSYASGVGAGQRINWWCSRYDRAYGNLINNDESLGDGSNRNFNFWPCIGATTTEILNGQVSKLRNKQDIITMSAGGNDVNFATLLDACIFQINERKALSSTCDPRLQETTDLINGPNFADNLKKLVDATVQKLASPSSRIFWTAYTHYFDVSTTECDSVTWATWMAIGRREYLTQARRNQWNGLVDLLNSKIENAISVSNAANPNGAQTVFVKWENKITLIDGKYCEPGIDETSKKGDDRETLAFYEWYSTLDDQVSGRKKRDALLTSIPSITQIYSADNAPADEIGLYEAAVIANISNILRANRTLIDLFHADNPGFDDIKDPIPVASLLADSITRVFHPQTNGHQLIASAILTALEQEQAKLNGKPAATTTMLGCSAPTGDPSKPGVRDMCFRDKPVANQIKFRLDDALTQVGSFCNSNVNQNISTVDGIKQLMPNGNSKISQLLLQVVHKTDGDCAPDLINPKTLKLSDGDCSQYFTEALNQCDTDTRTEKQGGQYTSECIQYVIYGVNAAPTSSAFSAPSASPTRTGAAEKLECHGISGNAWIVNRDIAIQNAADFCSQSLKSVEYNQGTFNDLILTVNYPADQSKTPRDAPDCHNRISNVVIDGCDGNDGNNNPHNYKYGGTYTASDSWVYMVEPKAIHIDDDNCDVSWKVAFDEFEVRGMNFPDAKLKVDGSGLLEQLRGCGAVTDWSFEMTPTDVKYQWYAHGNLPFGTRACVGRAVESAGGSSTGNCNGLG